MIDRTDDRQSCAERAQDFRQTDLIEEVDEQVGRGRAAVDHEQIVRFRSREDAVDLASMFEIDELRFGWKRFSVEFSWSLSIAQ